MGINIVCMCGNLTRDIELRYTPAGAAVAELSVALNRKYKDNAGEIKEEVSFIGVVVFGKLAELCKDNLHKGNQVFVSGRLKQDTWIGEGGKKGSKTKVIAEQVIFGNRPVKKDENTATESEE